MDLISWQPCGAKLGRHYLGTLLTSQCYPWGTLAKCGARMAHQEVASIGGEAEGDKIFVTFQLSQCRNKVCPNELCFNETETRESEVNAERNREKQRERERERAREREREM